jgi:sulfite exporter TauE/SafE
MSPEVLALTMTAAVVAFVHTLLGPDHYLPFVALARARQWSRAHTLRITLLCGAGHLVGSMVLGLLGIALGLSLTSLEWFEGVRAGFAAWLLVAFGLVYAAWGIRRAWRDTPHSHWHSHGDVTHDHVHDHHAEHAHVHEQDAAGITPWIIFIIFVLGPCEPLVPLLMYPAARESLVGVATVTLVFGVVTVLTMLLAVWVSLAGLQRFNLRRYQRFSHALAGTAVLGCGLAVLFLGI